MEDFKNTKLIYMAGLDIYQVDNLNQLNEVLFGKTYNVLTEEEKIVKRMERILPLSLAKNLPLINIGDIKEFSPQLMYSIIIDNEKMFYTSLCKNKIIDILERKDVNIFISEKLKNNNFKNFQNLEIESASKKKSLKDNLKDNLNEKKIIECNSNDSDYSDQISEEQVEFSNMEELKKEKSNNENDTKFQPKNNHNNYNDYYEINKEDKNIYYKISEKAKEIIIEQIMKNRLK